MTFERLGPPRRTRRAAFSALVVVVVVVVSVVLSGCAPDDITGVGLTAERAPTLLNCGTYIGAVQVSDGQSARAIWSSRTCHRDERA